MVLTPNTYTILKNVPLKGTITYPNLRKRCHSMDDEEFKDTLLYLKYNHVINHHFNGDRDVIRDSSEFSVEQDATQLIYQYKQDKVSRRIGVATLIISIITLMITLAPFLKYVIQSLVFSN